MDAMTTRREIVTVLRITMNQRLLVPRYHLVTSSMGRIYCKRLIYVHSYSWSAVMMSTNPMTDDETEATGAAAADVVSTHKTYTSNQLTTATTVATRPQDP
jgi:hypothetical protein